jgi:hypothetical protein
MTFASRHPQAFHSIAEMQNHIRDGRYAGTPTEIDSTFTAFVDACLYLSNTAIQEAASTELRLTK